MSRATSRTTTAGIALCATLAAGTAPLAADDTEVFFGAVDETRNSDPNVLFVLDTSGSMNYTDDGQEGTRLRRMKEAMRSILEGSANVNVGLMRLNGANGGGAVIYPIKPIDEEICRGANCGSVHLSYAITDDADDAEENLDDADHYTSTDGSILSLGRGNGVRQAVGMRFDEVAIPPGANITSARLDLVAQADSTGDASFTIRGIDEDDTPGFVQGDRSGQGDVTRRPLTEASATWQPEPWTADEPYTSDDFADVIEEIVARDDWCSGDPLAIRIDGTGQRDAHSFKQFPDKAPRLRVSYDVSTLAPTGDCNRRTVVAQIARGSDDATERYFSGRVATGESYLRIARRSTGYYDYARVGLRFDDLAIPNGAIIEEAELILEVDAHRSGSAHVEVRAQAHDDAPSFVGDDFDLRDRETVGSSVTWTLPASYTNAKLRSPPLAAVVQDVVERPGWTPGNAIVFRLDPYVSNDFRQVDSYEGERGAAAKLRVVYQTPIDVPEGDGVSTIVARDELKQVVDSMTAYHGTPIVDAYYEAAQYLLGGPVDYGRQRGAEASRWHRVSHPDSYTGGTVSRDSRCEDGNLNSGHCTSERITGSPSYRTSMSDACQTNHVVFLSDGAPTSNSSAAKVRALTGVDGCDPASGNEACGRELATWLYETDHDQGISRRQNIDTYTIGFNTESSFLQDLAVAGGGKYYDAESADELLGVFESIISEVSAIDTSFVAPGATVNQFNRLTHRDDIYFAVFKPSTRPVWDGNLKRYRLAKPDGGGEIAILDVDGNPAVDQESGFFTENAKSWWSDAIDGAAVARGGAAGEIRIAADGNGNAAASGRQVYTYTDPTPVQGGPKALIRAGHALSEDNARITDEMLGIDGMPGTAGQRAAYRETLLKWARGVDVLDTDLDDDDTDVRPHMGDPMHARPLLLNYGGAGGSSTTVFVATNEGFLHAIDPSDGSERFAFIPQELLGNLVPYFENEASTKHPYGLDGSLSVWTDDANDNVLVDGGEEAYLYVGMRRGGSRYYAFDVSERDDPKLAWSIDETTDGFEELGQSWSQAVPAEIMIGGERTPVLIFGAGYDTNQDVDTSSLVRTRTTDTRGRGVFMVHARTGERVWAGLGTFAGSDKYFSAMDYSIPSDVRVIDINQDGLADQFYVGDMGGRVWRFDIAPYHQGDASTLVDGGIIADLGGTSPAEHRRFFYQPDVSLVAAGGERHLAISIGSGWRAHPLDDRTEDRFYVLRSDAVSSKPAGYGILDDGLLGPSWRPVVESDLVDITDDLQPALGSAGFYLRLEETGEKVLGAAATVENQIVFTSYKPALLVDACSTAVGSGAVYALDLRDGSAALDMDGDGVDEKSDRQKALRQGGLPPPPAPLLTEDGPAMLIGAELLQDLVFGGPTRTYWVDSGSDPSVAGDIELETAETGGEP